MFKSEISGDLTSVDFAHHGVGTVGGRSSALADDFFEASLVDCCIAFWAHANKDIRDILEGKSDFKCRRFKTLTSALVSLLVESPEQKK